MGVKIDSMNFVGIERRLANLADDKTMTEIHQAFARYMEPYVPMDEGMLAHNVTVTPQYVGYNQPYAHYQYTGIVYGPNYPITENGEIVGYYSPPNKQPTGAALHYSTEKHPLATHHWDKRMMEDKGDAFTAEVRKIIIDKLKEGGNG